MTVAAVRRGYVVVVQDTRGQFKSEGRFVPYSQEIGDGYETIEWVARLPYVDGQVGMFGLSYPGAVQWMAAPGAPRESQGDCSGDDVRPSESFLLSRRSIRGGLHRVAASTTDARAASIRAAVDGPEEIAKAWAQNGDVDGSPAARGACRS